MPPHVDTDSDWSDSDDDRSDLETSVLLGIPDSTIEKQEDLDDAAVSRVGGHPAFLPSIEPPLSSSQCKICSFPMELLVQLWCPFEESTMDRALYVFGCARGECQHKDGSVRAFRGLRFNTEYAAKLEKKRARQREKEAAKAKAKKEEEQKKAAAKINPFSMKAGTTASSGLFGSAPTFGANSSMSGLGSQLFGAPPGTEDEGHGHDAAAPPPPDSESESDSEAEDDVDSESDESILAAPALTPAEASPWRAAPSYTPLYLSTALEYVPPPPKVKAPIGVDDGEIGSGKSRKAEERREEREEKDRLAWDSAMEGYEDSMEVDKVFERFARRAGYEGEQCIRYELGGTPMPYAHDALFNTLFPSPSTFSSVQGHGKVTLVTQAQSKVESAPARRTYDARSAAIAPCPRCGSTRVFECQLMPHLISVLQRKHAGVDLDADKNNKKVKTEGGGEDSAEARKQEVERLLRGGGKRGMDWGTCMVFSCEKDCCLEEGKEAKEAWAEELVLVQWEE
ncbi:hypothetical protein M0805_001412 [Coniferiporia weirii]|nr:hypothetical protein M0805_001412 [Coniferiporia weirii]